MTNELRKFQQLPMLRFRDSSRAPKCWASETIPCIVHRVDRNLVLYLPRLAVLVSIEADRPGAWFPGPLGPYQAWFPGIQLSRDFERVKVPGTPTESPFCFCFFWEVEFINNCLRA
jgi:hypothetical protein